MEKGAILVIGASGDVGQGIVEAALISGRKVVACGRSREALDRVARRFNSESLACVTGDISTETGAEALWNEAVKPFRGIHDVVVSVNAPNILQPLMEWSSEELTAMFASNVVTHFVAAKVFQPKLPESGMLIGIGGGTADFIMPKMAYVSMAQAALRMLFKGLSRERKTGAAIRELMIVSMVAGESNRAQAQPEWVTDFEVGQHVCAILDDPREFSGSVLHLRSREQVGQPEPSPALRTN